MHKSKYGMLRAAKRGDLDEVKRYVESGTPVQLCSSTGLTPLHISSHHGFESVVRYLLSKGAKIDAPTKQGNTPLHIACLSQRLEIVDLLIREGANVNDQSKDKFTPLYMAAQKGNVEIVKLLLRSGADKTLKESNGFGPIDVADQQGHEEAASLLRDDAAACSMQAAGVSPIATVLGAALLPDTPGTTLSFSNNDALLSLSGAESMMSSLTITDSDFATDNTDDFLPSYEDVMANKQFYGIKDVRYF